VKEKPVKQPFKKAFGDDIMGFELLHGNCLTVMAEMDDNTIDSIVCDPPYGLHFMQSKWDYDVPSVEIWKEALRVLKPGGHLLSFAGSRTYHRMAVNIEDAGFEIRDQIMWVYGSGFPKSLNISKAIDKAKGAERKVVGYDSSKVRPNKENYAKRTAPATPEAKQWDGWGSALKPAHEPIVVARKPLIGTIVENVLEHGTGGLNIDGCRVGTNDKLVSGGNLVSHSADERTGQALGMFQQGTENTFVQNPKGRFPANIIFDKEASAMLDEQSGFTQSGAPRNDREQSIGAIWGKNRNHIPCGPQYGDKGGASRFFYCAKASKDERNAGLEHFVDVERTDYGGFHSEEGLIANGRNPANRLPMKNPHPTVKPVALMRYLCRLVTQPNGITLDPFMGSGTTGIAATQEGFNFIGIEMSEEYIEIAKQRINHWSDAQEEIIKEKNKQTFLW